MNYELILDVIIYTCLFVLSVKFGLVMFVKWKKHKAQKKLQDMYDKKIAEMKEWKEKGGKHDWMELYDSDVDTIVRACKITGWCPKRDAFYSTEYLKTYYELDNKVQAAQATYKNEVMSQFDLTEAQFELLSKIIIKHVDIMNKLLEKIK